MKWISRNSSNPSTVSMNDWAKRLEISPPLAALLWQRGFKTFEDASFYLNPSLKHLAPLEDWPGLLPAAQIITDKLLRGEKMAVWGDYDVDGITATALVVSFLSRHGFIVLPHIPNRLEDGYGLNKDGLKSMVDQGITLLLTVDCGISNVEETAYAKSLGMTVIVSDHHLPAEELPAADGVVNPRLGDSPCPSLAGVGVAFFLMAAVNSLLHKAGKPKLDPRPLLDLVALGTLADVVDLNGQNRVLVKNGLLVIAKGARVGIAALKNACNHAPTANLDSAQVVFALAPRINASGRLGSASTALELLLTEDKNRAAELAEELCRLNAERKAEEDRIADEARKQALSLVEQGAIGLVLYNPNWHPGIIGIVASRIMEEFNRPAIVLGEVNCILKGSGRSIGDFDIHAALSCCSDLCLSFGGHRMAAGVSIDPFQLKKFKERFNELATDCLGPTPAEHECKLDGELDFEAASDFTLLKELEMLQPFGMGNPEPVFASAPVKIKSMLPRSGLMLLDLEDEKTGLVLKAKAWRRLADIPLNLKGKNIRIAFTPRIDRYNGIATVELRMKDWKVVCGL